MKVNGVSPTVFAKQIFEKSDLNYLFELYVSIEKLIKKELDNRLSFLFNSPEPSYNEWGEVIQTDEMRQTKLKVEMYEEVNSKMEDLFLKKVNSLNYFQLNNLKIKKFLNESTEDELSFLQMKIEELVKKYDDNIDADSVVSINTGEGGKIRTLDLFDQVGNIFNNIGLLGIIDHLLEKALAEIRFNEQAKLDMEFFNDWQRAEEQELKRGISNSPCPNCGHTNCTCGYSVGDVI